MSDLRRLVEDDDDFVRDLVGSAVEDAPDGAAKEKTLALLAGGALGANPGVGGADGALKGVGAAKAGAGASVLSKWVVISVLGVVGVSGAVWLTRHSEPVAQAPMAESVPAVSPAVPAIVETVTPVAEAPPAAQPVPTVVPTSTPSTSQAAAPVASSAPTLTQELAMLDEARTALVAGNAKGALASLDRYDRSRAKNLTQEATMLRIEALVAAGRRDQATGVAKRLLAAHPGSAYENRIRSLLPSIESP